MRTPVLCVLLAWTMTARGQALGGMFCDSACQSVGIDAGLVPAPVAHGIQDNGFKDLHPDAVYYEYVMEIDGIDTSLYAQAYAQDDQDAPELAGMWCVVLHHVYCARGVSDEITVKLEETQR